MKWSLLDIVQEILNDMDSDEVNSIDDTIEATQVAQIVKSTYFAMMSNRNWPHLKKAIRLIPTADLDKPTYMYIPDIVKELTFVNYDARKTTSDRAKWVEQKWKDPEEFLKLVNQYNGLNENVDIVKDPSGIDVAIMNDRHPTYFTSFDDTTLIFNSYDKARESNLQSTFIQSMAYVMPEWRHVDSAIPDIPEEAFIALIEEAKSRASAKLRQQPDQKAEQESGRQQRWLSRKARKVAGGIQYPNYGRRGRGRNSSSYIDKDN
jgi:hypothetical protein